MIRCQKCHQSKTEEEFPFACRGEPERRSTCRACISESYRAWSAKNREVLLERKRVYWHQTGKQLRQSKQKEPNQ